MKKKVLLAGGCGFIGHNLAIFLKKKKFDVYVADGLKVNNIDEFKKTKTKNSRFYINILLERKKLLKKYKIKFFKKDFRNFKNTKLLINKIKPNFIIHLAAVAHANKSNKNPHNSFEHSILTLENILECCRSSKHLERLIFLSSSMVYGQFKSRKVTENSICTPLGIYAALKYSCEKMVIAYNQVFGLPYTIIRPSALYGERCVSNRVIQKFIESAIINKPLEILGDGKERLDFTYIEDLISGIYKCIINKKSKNQIFNLTYGKSRTVIDALKIIQKKFKNLKIIQRKRDKLIPFRGTLSVKKAKNLIKYNPKFPIEKGIPKYISWYLKKKIS
jgi:nucleoside-diphosphate-sugar epimerase